MIELAEQNAMLVPFDEVVAEIEKYKDLNAKLAFDYEDEKGNKDARSHVYSLRRVKGRIAEIHKDVKANVLKVSKEIDARKRELTAPVEEMIYFHDKHIKEIEQREEKAKEEMIRKAQEEKEAEDAARLEAIRMKEEELAAKAAALKAKEDEANRIEREAEVAAKAKAEAEEKAAKDLADAAAAKAESERQAAIALDEAEKKRIADVQAAEEKAKREQEEKEAAQKAEQERLAEIERQRQEDVAHREMVNKEVHGIFTEYGMPDDAAQRLVKELDKDTFPSLSINY